MNLNPGKLDKKITIFEISEDQDKDGFSTGDRNVVRTPWASFRRLSGSEKMEAGIDMAEERVRFVCRYSEKKITPRMFIEYAGEVYNILSVNDYNDAHEYIEIQAKKG